MTEKWHAGSKIPPADWDATDEIGWNRRRGIVDYVEIESKGDWDPILRKRTRKSLETEDERERALDRLARGAGLALCIAIAIGMIIGALLTWLAMR